VRIIRELVDPNKASEITGSKAEARYGELLHEAHAPKSETQYPIGPYRVDRCWPELKLVVEIDGTQFHRDRKRMETDNARQDYVRHHGHALTRAAPDYGVSAALRGSIRILAWRSGLASAVKAASTPSSPTVPVISGRGSTLPSPSMWRVSRNSSGV
jgi:hypothetical protein